VLPSRATKAAVFLLAELNRASRDVREAAVPTISVTPSVLFALVCLDTRTLLLVGSDFLLGAALPPDRRIAT